MSFGKGQPDDDKEQQTFTTAADACNTPPCKKKSHSRQDLAFVLLLFLCQLAFWYSQGKYLAYQVAGSLVPLKGGSASRVTTSTHGELPLPTEGSSGRQLGKVGTGTRSLSRHMCTYMCDTSQTRCDQEYIGRTELGEIDIVYLWVNGSDAVHRASLRHWAEMELGGGETLVESPAANSRFASDRDELRFSVRSLVQHLPWFRHLYIVTSGEVPSWLNISNRRVTVVPHSSIMQPQDLPTFNSNAIESNVHRIPGLSENFIVMNDDLFLTKDWSLDDLATPEGGEVFYEFGPAPSCRPGDGKCTRVDSLFGEMLIYVDLLFLRFSRRERFEQAHSMHFIQKSWMQQLQNEFAAEYRATSAHHFRSKTDMQFAAAYKWFYQEFQTECRNRRAAPGLTQLIMLREESYRMLSRWLENAWSNTSNVKLVCLNDNISDFRSMVSVYINELVTGFLNSQYPDASEFELPPGQTNSCRHLKSSFGVLPTADDLRDVCM